MLRAEGLVNESGPNQVPVRSNRPGPIENDDGNRI